MNFELWDLALLFLCAKIGGTVFSKLRQPSLIGELLAGAVLGMVFVDMSSSATINVVGQLGILFLILLTMLSLDLSPIEQELERLVVAQVFTAAIIFVLLVGLFSFLGTSMDMVLVVGAAVFGSSTVISVKVLTSMKELNSREGQTIVGFLVIKDIVELLLIAAVINVLKYHEFNYEPVLSLVLMIIGTFVVMSRVGYRYINGIMNSIGILKMDEVLVALTLLLAFSTAAITEALGLTTYLGIMLIGVLISRTQYAAPIARSIKELGEGFFIPVFFATLGLSVSVLGIFENISWLVVLLVLLTAVRFVAGFIPSLASGYSLEESCKIAAGMLPMSEYGLLMLSLGISYGVLTEADYSVLVVVFLIVNVLTPFAMSAVFRVRGSCHATPGRGRRTATHRRGCRP